MTQNNQPQKATILQGGNTQKVIKVLSLLLAIITVVMSVQITTFAENITKEHIPSETVTIKNSKYKDNNNEDKTE